MLGRDSDAATATALKAIQDVESEEREAARLREQKIAQKASFNEEYDTGERNDSTRALIYMQQLPHHILALLYVLFVFKDGVISFLVVRKLCGRRDQNKHWNVLQLLLHFCMTFVSAAEVEIQGYLHSSVMQRFPTLDLHSPRCRRRWDRHQGRPEQEGRQSDGGCRG